MIGFEKTSRRAKIKSITIRLVPAFIPEPNSDIAYGRVRAAVTKVDNSAQALPRKDQIFSAHIPVDRKTGQRVISRAPELFKNANAFLHMRREETMVLPLIVGDLELHTPEAVQKPWVFKRDRIRLFAS